MSFKTCTTFCPHFENTTSCGKFWSVPHIKLLYEFRICGIVTQTQEQRGHSVKHLPLSRTKERKSFDLNEDDILIWGEHS